MPGRAAQAALNYMDDLRDEGGPPLLPRERQADRGGHQLRCGPLLTSARSAPSSCQGASAPPLGHDIELLVRATWRKGSIVSSSPMTIWPQKIGNRSRSPDPAARQEGSSQVIHPGRYALPQAAELIEKCARGGVRRLHRTRKHQSESLPAPEAPRTDHRNTANAVRKHAGVIPMRVTFWDFPGHAGMILHDIEVINASAKICSILLPDALPGSEITRSLYTAGSRSIPT